MSHHRRNVVYRAPVRKRSIAGLWIVAAAIVAVVGATIVLTRNLEPTTSAQASAAVTAKATIIPATAVLQAPSVAQDPTAAQPAPVTQAPAAAPQAASGGEGKDGGAQVTAQDGTIRLSAADFSDSQARFFTYKGGSKMIPFFVMKSSDGVIRAAFDACDVCFESKKGYHQEGDVMVCNNCGSRFPSARINIESGGCNPTPLVRETQGGSILIKAADLEAGTKYF